MKRAVLRNAIGWPLFVCSPAVMGLGIDAIHLSGDGLCVPLQSVAMIVGGFAANMVGMWLTYPRANERNPPFSLISRK